MSLLTHAVNLYRARAEKRERQHGNDPRKGFSPQNPFLGDLWAAQACARMQRKEVIR